jgi:hypothetical protein
MVQLTNNIFVSKEGDGISDRVLLFHPRERTRRSIEQCRPQLSD